MKCSVCNGHATLLNKSKQPVCSKHLHAKVTSPLCPDCGLTMTARTGKFGSFWGCIAFPSCSGVRKI